MDGSKWRLSKVNSCHKVSSGGGYIALHEDLKAIVDREHLLTDLFLCCLD
ncbi:MAG: hypothetical protein KME27_16000 [Lyngbya sp. HA4199-MV5]|nr:hypothetical protein [Lyngbya sp. HA4199-MV5]